MRAVLITNPSASTSGGWSRDVIVRSLEAEYDLETLFTTHRGHATDIAADARRRGIDLVITIGGDGTINETINGLLREDCDLAVPLLATIPGGLANVFPRALGLSSDAMAACGQIIEAVAAGSVRTIPLGKWNERYFCFNAGIGFDAGIVEAVEAHRADGQKASPALYMMAGFKHYFEETDRTTAHLTVTSDSGHTIENVFMLIVQNTTPWSFIGHVALDFSTEASFERGLEAVALTSMSPVSVATYLAEAAARIPTSRRSNVEVISDTSSITVTSDIELPVQVDGDSLGLMRQARIVAVPEALEVVIPLES
jgi:diacylglycerol kinase family enzyme